MISLQSVTKRFGSVVAVDNVTFTVEEGEMVAIVGGSGSGKSTTLRLVNRLVSPDEGSVCMDGENVLGFPAYEIRRRTGIVFQRSGLFPHMTVFENIAVTPRLLGWDAIKIQHRVEETLALVELDAQLYAARFPHQLSGGQQQRVGVARALAAKPRVVLFDEPFGALDPITRQKLQQSLPKIRRDTGLTGIFVTHDMVEAMFVADRIGVMRRGKLLQMATAQELLSDPADDYVAELLSTPAKQAQQVEKILGISPYETHG